MVRWLMPLVVWAVLVADSPGQSRVGQPIVVPGGAAAKPAVTPAAEPAKGIALRVIERRRLGLTVVNVCRILRDMKAEDKLSQFKGDPADDGIAEIDVSSLAVAVAERMAAENPQGWADIDWDQVLLFLEKLLELILKLLPLILALF